MKNKVNQVDLLVMQKIAERSVKFLEEMIGSCPADSCGYEKIDCENLCETEGRSAKDCNKCWKDYFMDDSNFSA